MNVSEPLIQASLIGEAIDGGPVLVFVADEDLRYVAVNQRACEALGYERDELLTLSVSDITRAPDPAASFSDLLANGARSGTAELRRKDGSGVTVEYQATRAKVAQMTVCVSVAWPAPAS